MAQPKYFEIKLNNETHSCGSNVLGGMTSLWQGDNPLNYVFPIFMLQIIVGSTFTATLNFLLEPFLQNKFLCQMIGGILAGPSFIGKTDLFKKEIFHRKTLYTFITMQNFGCMFYMFLVGVKMDLSIVKKSGKKAWLIGLFCYLLPMLLTTSIVAVIHKSVKMNSEKAFSVSITAMASSVTSFHTIACFLSDLKLLNSELGQVTLSASMISGICSWISSLVVFSIKQSSKSDKPKTFLWMMLSSCALVMCIVYLLRPIMYWIVKQTHEDKRVKEPYLFFMFVLVLVSAFVGELIGQHFLIGPIILGLVVPAGAPLGTAIEEKLECFVTTILLPMVIMVTVYQVDIFQIGIQIFAAVDFLVLFGFLGKLIGTMLPALYYRMPFQDALLMGLIMNVQGVLETQFWMRALRVEVITKEIYGVLMVSMIIITGTISPLVRYLYNPSRKYKAYKKRTIEHSKCNTEFRILACVYDDENVPTILNLLEASHPTIYSPICLYVLHLIELQGRASPLLVAHKRFPNDSSSFNPSSRIINAFQYYEQDNKTTVHVSAFTAISPYSTIHDDICTLGLEKRTTLIIIPFHNQPTVDSTFHSSAAIRKVNQNILNNAPCSVGILIDRGSRKPASMTPSILDNMCSYHVAVIFFGGADDREALAYGVRMGEDINVNLNVIRLIPFEERVSHIKNQKKLDDDAINEFRISSVGKENVSYTEEVVRDGVELVLAMKSIMNSFELLMVGRQHAEDSSQILEGLEDWNEFPELGVIGDILATYETECKGSVLVVQQQIIASKSYKLRNILHRYDEAENCQHSKKEEKK